MELDEELRARRVDPLDRLAKRRDVLVASDGELVDGARSMGVVDAGDLHDEEPAPALGALHPVGEEAVAGSPVEVREVRAHRSHDGPILQGEVSDGEGRGEDPFSPRPADARAGLGRSFPLCGRRR